MKVSKARCLLRGALCGFVFASLGFSFSLATSPEGVESRGISTNATRLPTAFFTPTDLGAVIVGTSFTRQVLVQYGFKPHVFSFGLVQPASSLTISKSGTISGVKSEGAESFSVQVLDDYGILNTPIITKTFTLESITPAFAPGTPLQFSIQQTGPFALLPALAHDIYSYTVQGNGGYPPYTFSFTSESDFAALPAGLALDSSGLIFGYPVIPTKIGSPAVFSLTVQDSHLETAKQTFSLVVAPNTISSNFIPTSGKFKLNFGKQGGQDNLNLSLVLDKTALSTSGVRTAADVVNLPISIEFGGVILPPAASNHPFTFDKTGTITFPKTSAGFPPAKDELLNYTIRLNPATGMLTLVFRNVSLIAGLNADMGTFKNPIIPINIKMGQAVTNASASSSSTSTVNFDETDSIQFQYKRTTATGTGQALPALRSAPGGLFLLSKVQGFEQAGTDPAVTADKLVLKLSGYLRQPGGTQLQPLTTDNVYVFLGTYCLGFFPASSLSTGNTLSFTNTDSTAAPLKSIVIDNQKGTFVIQTYPVLAKNIFNVDALIAGVPYPIPLTLTVATSGLANATFDGQSSVVVFRRGNQLHNK